MQNIDCYFQPELLAIPNSAILVAVAEARMFSCNDEVYLTRAMCV